MRRTVKKRIRADRSTMEKLWGCVDHNQQRSEYIESSRLTLVTSLSEIGWRQPLPNFITGDTGLGPMPRLALIREAITADGETFFSQICKEMSSVGFLISKNEINESVAIVRDKSVPQVIPKENLEKLLQPGQQAAPDASKFLSIPIIEALTRLVNRLQSRGGGDIEPFELFSRGFKGKHAVTNYWNWLTKGDHVLKQNDQLLDFDRANKFLTSDNPIRANAIDEAERYLLEPTPDWPAPLSNGSDRRLPPMIINLHQENMWGGLSAAANELMKRAKQRSDSQTQLDASSVALKCCYIPLLRRTNGGSGLSYPSVVGFLAGFMNGYHDPSTYPVPTTPGQVAAEIAEIKKLMAIQPAIIFFDGYTDVDIGFNQIGRVITDNHILRLATRLIETPVNDVDAPTDLDTFRRNRIVILSDRKITDNDKALSYAPIKTIDIPRPNPDDIPEILKWQKLTHLDDILFIRDQVPSLEEETSEAVFAALDTLITTSKETQGFSRPRLAENLRTTLAPSSETPGSRSHLAEISRIVIKEIRKQSPEQLIILMTIALAPGGIRIETLSTILKNWRKLKLTDSLKKLQEKQINVEKQTDSLLAKLKSIVSFQRDDAFEGFDQGISSQKDSKNRGAAVVRYRTRPAIDFVVPEIRRELLWALSESKDCQKKQNLIHRLLAEENIRQQTIAIRNTPGSAETSLRAYRRLVATIYHGLRSIPFTKDNKFKELSYMPLGTIPKSSQDAWVWIALYAYRRMLERPTEWNLMRRFSMPVVKREILMMVAQPWLASSIQQGNPHDGNLDIVFDSLKFPGNEELIEKIRLDHQLALAQTEAVLARATTPGQMKKRAKKIKRDIGKQSLSDSERLHIIKRNSDLAMMHLAPETAMDFLDLADDVLTKKISSIKLGSSAFTNLQQAVDELSKQFNSTVGTKNFRPTTFSVAFSSVAHINLRVSGDLDENTMEDLADILNRIGERWATIADIGHGELRLEVPHDDRRYPEINSVNSAIKMFSKAMAFFYIAEQIRLQSFDKNPLGTGYLISGHTARTLIRTCIKLETLSRLDFDSEDTTIGFYGQYARHIADVWARGLFRFDQERCSMLIMECTIRRSGNHQINQIGFLQECLNDLRSAEKLVLRLGFASRVRLRFFLEKTKIYRRLSDYYLDQDNKQIAVRYYKLARYELELLSSLSSFHNSVVWNQLVNLQKVALKSHSQKLGGD